MKRETKKAASAKMAKRRNQRWRRQWRRKINQADASQAAAASGIENQHRRRLSRKHQAAKMAKQWQQPAKERKQMKKACIRSGGAADENNGANEMKMKMKSVNGWYRKTRKCGESQAKMKLGMAKAAMAKTVRNRKRRISHRKRNRRRSIEWRNHRNNGIISKISVKTKLKMAENGQQQRKIWQSAK